MFHDKRLVRLVYLVTLTLAVACFISTVGCAANGSGSSADVDGMDTASAAWSMDSDCQSCHQIESNCLAQLHTNQNVNCTSCHTDNTGLQAAHQDATADGAAKVTKLSKSKMSIDACETCHSIADLAAKTADSKVLTDANGKTVNPHDLPSGHLGNKVTCFDCHRAHDGSDVADNAPKACISCHHQDVYECNTCHQ